MGQHKGLFPSYDEVVALYATIDSSEGAPRLISNINILNGDLEITNRGQLIAYGVANDRHAYILRGVGENQKFVQFSFLRWNFKVYIGSEYPVFQAVSPDPDK